MKKCICKKVERLEARPDCPVHGMESPKDKVEECEKCGRTSGVVDMARCPFCEPLQDEGWEREFDEDFKYLGEDEYDLTRKGIKDFIRSLLTTQKEGIRKKIKDMGFYDYDGKPSKDAEIVKKIILAELNK
jgi:hypothetical protein